MWQVFVELKTELALLVEAFVHQDVLTKLLRENTMLMMSCSQQRDEGLDCNVYRVCLEHLSQHRHLEASVAAILEVHEAVDVVHSNDVDERRARTCHV